ncbi:MAG: substrate-binding domain-containing protein, partial [Candidatus Binatia bacterium]
LAVRAAARALALDFIPVANEQYDLLMAGDFFDSPRGQLLLRVISSESFKHAVNALSGYDTEKAGMVFYRQ